MDVVIGEFYCLGGSLSMTDKCNTCLYQKNWNLLNEMPDTWRLTKQKTMKRVENTTCGLLNAGYHKPSVYPVADIRIDWLNKKLFYYGQGGVFSEQIHWQEDTFSYIYGVKFMLNGKEYYFERQNDADYIQLNKK